jgi:hypothetical protein
VLGTAAIVLVGVGLAGVSGLGGGPLGVLLAVAALAAAVAATRAVPAVARWLDAAAVGLAGAAALAPLLALGVQERVGQGTAARLGVLGDPLAWAAPVAGVVAGAALLLVGRRRSSVALQASGVVVAVSGVLVGAARLDLPDAVWWCVPGLLILALQVVAMATTRSPAWRPLTTTAADAASVLAAASIVWVWIPVVALAGNGELRSRDVAAAAMMAMAAAACGLRDRTNALGRVGALGTAPWATVSLLAAGIVWWVALPAIVVVGVLAWSVRP